MGLEAEISPVENVRKFIYQICVQLTHSTVEGKHLFYIIERKVLGPHRKRLERCFSEEQDQNLSRNPLGIPLHTPLHAPQHTPLHAPSQTQVRSKNTTHSSKMGGATYHDTHVLSVDELEIYQAAFRVLLKYVSRFSTTLAPSERLILDSTLDTTGRLQNFESYFRRLPPSDQLILLLKNLFHWPVESISRCLQIPQGTLETQEWMAYRNLESWIWEGRT